METIKITVKDDGTTVLDCNGFQGTRCDITKVAEEALGLVEDRNDKDEYYRNELQTNEFDMNQ